MERIGSVKLSNRTVNADQEGKFIHLIEINHKNRNFSSESILPVPFFYLTMPYILEEKTNGKWGNILVERKIARSGSYYTLFWCSEMDRDSNNFKKRFLVFDTEINTLSALWKKI